MAIDGRVCYLRHTVSYESYIAAVGAHVPERRMHNDELAALVDTSDEWIFSHTGIRYRHIAAEGQSASDLAEPAARQALSRAGIAAEEVDLVLLATSTPDYLGLPSTACVVQQRLGATRAAAMDITAACTGFVYALETARTFVAAGAARTVLVIGSEVYSSIIDWTDRRTCVLFGDGAGAAVVRRAESDSPSRLLPAILGSRGADAQALYVPAGGTRNRLRRDETTESDLKLQMDGRRVYTFAVTIVADVIQSLLSREGMAFEDLAYVVPHQANVRIIQAAAKRAGWDPARFYTNIAEYANTSAASIPIALNEMSQKGLLHRGSPLATVGFGGGLTWGGMLLYW